MSRQSLKNVIRLINEANESLPVEKAFLTDLKRSIELSDAKNSRKPSKTYKPSSMNCIRNMYYQVTGQDQDSEPSSYCLVGICNSGTDIHERIQKAVSDMKNNGIRCEYLDVGEFVKQNHLDNLQVVSKSGMETKLFYKNLNMSFLCDGIVRYKGKEYILEIKTESSFKWQKRTGVDPAHFNQATAYSTAFKLDHVLFLYINRDVLDMKMYDFVVSDDMREELLGKIAQCDSYVQRFTVPPKPESFSNKFCQYCNYKSACAKDGD